MTIFDMACRRSDVAAFGVGLWRRGDVAGAFTTLAAAVRLAGMARRNYTTRLPAPYLRQLRVDAGNWPAEREYPFNLPFLSPDFEIGFEQPVTIFVGENGTGKSTLIEAIAAMAGYDEAGGGKGYRPVDHSKALDQSGAALADILRAGWLPKVTRGWFFRAESFFSVARYLDEVADAAPPDFLSHSHGEGFLRFFNERMATQSIFFLDEPESALSPRRQLDLLRLLVGLQREASAQVIMATHSPILMMVPGADLFELTRGEMRRSAAEDTSHFRLWLAFTADPEGFVASAVAGDEDMLF